MGRILARIRIGFRLLLGQPFVPKGVRLGKNVFIGSWVRFDQILDGALIEISDYATIAPGAVILCHDASSNRRTGGTWAAPVHIGVRAFIGEYAILLPGVRVGADSIVAAGAVVTRDVEPGTIVAGVPAVKIGSVDETDTRRAIEMRSKPVFDSAQIRNWPHVTDDRKREVMDAAEKQGGFFIFTREIYEEYQRTKGAANPTGQTGR